jgi:hypothetical protein
MSTTNGNEFLRAVRAREHRAAAPGGAEVWKYALPLGANHPVEEIHVRRRAAGNAPGLDGPQWTGIFECARNRHLDVLSWPAANAVVVAAANAVYIVDPGVPEQFSGFVAPGEINDVTFDESAQRMFVADSLHVYAFSSDRLFQWMSEPLDGYGPRFCGCGGRVLAVELKQCGPELEGDEEAPSIVRLRTEDGTILRSRFRLARHYRMKGAAAS